MRKTIYEIEEPLHLLDTKGVWRVSVSQTTGTPIYDEQKHFVDYKRGDVIQFSAPRFVDADRASFSGYVVDTVEIPASVVLEAARALELGELPRERD